MRIRMRMRIRSRMHTRWIATARATVENGHTARSGRTDPAQTQQTAMTGADGRRRCLRIGEAFGDALEDVQQNIESAAVLNEHDIQRIDTDHVLNALQCLQPYGAMRRLCHCRKDP